MVLSAFDPVSPLRRTREAFSFSRKADGSGARLVHPSLVVVPSFIVICSSSFCDETELRLLLIRAVVAYNFLTLGHSSRVTFRYRVING